jgi:hypothetical protein
MRGPHRWYTMCSRRERGWCSLSSVNTSPHVIPHELQEPEKGAEDKIVVLVN